jgi:hypothetical protein
MAQASVGLSKIHRLLFLVSHATLRFTRKRSSDSNPEFRYGAAPQV